MYPMGTALLDSLNPRAKTFVVFSSPHSSAGSPAPGRKDEVPTEAKRKNPKGGEVSIRKVGVQDHLPVFLGVFSYLEKYFLKFIFLHIQKKTS